MTRCFATTTVIALSALALMAQEARPPATRAAPPASWLDPNRSDPPGIHYRTFKSKLADSRPRHLAIAALEDVTFTTDSNGRKLAQQVAGSIREVLHKTLTQHNP